jgi:hypothetical protein
MEWQVDILVNVLAEYEEGITAFVTEWRNIGCWKDPADLEAVDDFFQRLVGERGVASEPGVEFEGIGSIRKAFEEKRMASEGREKGSIKKAFEGEGSYYPASGLSEGHQMDLLVGYKWKGGTRLIGSTFPDTFLIIHWATTATGITGVQLINF